VELQLSGLPRVVNVQAVPNIEEKTVRVVAEVEGLDAKDSKIAFRVRESATGREVGTFETPYAIKDGKSVVDVRVPIQDCRLWSPEEPFLYDLEVSTTADALHCRFGMRSFRLDSKTGYAILNGKTIFFEARMWCIHRFLRRPAARATLPPWNEQWVRKLHRTFKSMH